MMHVDLDRLRQRLARQNARVDYERERFMAQIQFGEFLCEQHPAEASAWKECLTDAVQHVENAVDGTPEAFSEAVREAEARLDPLCEAAKRYTIYCVGHAHIDMNWMWSWPETVATTNDTFTTVLRLMEEFPEFIFSQSQASVYRIVEQHNPQLLQKIAQRIDEGRWEVTASHWVEGDKNLASAESLCRHLLYTRRYMRDLFGLEPQDIPIDWSPDTFGHAHTVPSYLVRGGVRYVYLHRPGAHTPPQPRPGAFWWRGPDGSQVLVRNDMRLGYNGQIGPHVVGQSLIPFTRETGLTFTMFVYGVGDHGGGPTRRDLKRLEEMQQWPLYPQFKAARACEFFERLEREGEHLPLIDDELNFEFSGCYTSQSLIKKANRYAEKKLVDAETINTLTHTMGTREYPGNAFEEGWRDTLFSHFHDILPGSGVHDTRTYTYGLYQKTIAMTGVQEIEALRSLASRIDTLSAHVEVDDDLPASRYPTAMGSGIGYQTANGNCSQYALGIGSDHRPFVIFNSLPNSREEIVEALVWDGMWGWEPKDLNALRFSVVPPDGVPLPAQVVETGNYWGHAFVKLAFPVSVPGLGYTMVIVKEEAAPPAEPKAWQTGLQHHCGYSYYERSPEGLENELLRLDLDMETGGIGKLLDKRSGLSLIDGPASILEYGIERERSMNAWLVEHTNGWRGLEPLSIRRGLNGPYKATMEVQLRIEQSAFTLIYELRAGDPTLYLHLRGTWFQRGHRQGVPVLRLSLPLALESAQTRYEIPFGAIDRDMQHGEEVPALRWAQVRGPIAGQPAGLLLLNDSKHGHSLEANRFNLTLIRGSSNPDPLPEIGDHEIHLGLHPFSGDLGVFDAIALARRFNHELKVINTDAHEGDLPPQAAFVSIESDTVVLDAIKKAEDDQAWILRFHEVGGQDSTVRVHLNEALLGGIRDVDAVDLLERPLTDPSVNLDGAAFMLSIPSRGIASVKVAVDSGLSR